MAWYLWTHVTDLHGSNAVAPLKQVDVHVGCHSDVAIHGSQAVAPLKLGRHRQRMTTLRLVSTATKPWPH